MFLNIKKYRRKAYRKILKVPIEKNAKYIYSGVPFLLFPELIMELTSREYEEVITERLFEPLGMYHTIYNPLGHFEASQIVPTEFDIRLRNKLVHGEVHDENAMALGGVSGNAGLFSNANDLGKIFQLYLNLGTYGGQTYLKKGTIQEFTKHQFCNNGNRRGLGFDKPECNGISDHVTDMASQESYGHTGFTGTYAWADPGQQLIYIFLSNRVYPSRMQREIYIQNLRNKIHEIIYEKTNEL
jgi:CubicO group peptidase (beta-lactamase class C family)